MVGCAVGYLWEKQPGRASLVGRVESVHYTVAAPRAGQVELVKGDFLQTVRKGEVLAKISPHDLGAVVARLHAHVDLLRAQLLQNTDRQLIDYQQFRLEWMRNNVDLSSAKIELELAEYNLQQAGTLVGTSIVSQAEFQLRKTRRDALKTRVDALAKINADLEGETELMRASLPVKANPAESPYEKAITAAMHAQSEELKSIEQSCTLVAPVDGMVVSVLKHPGENLVAGDAVLVMGTLQASRIVAYMRQPLGVPLQPGDRIEVGVRDARRMVFESKVAGVGAQLEAIDPSLLPLSADKKNPESGLPFLVEIPSGTRLVPGEILSLRWLGRGG
jgi:multidrug resistance efflux pump